MAVLALSNPVVQSYIVYSAILALKLISVSAMTTIARMTRGSFGNPEDAKAFRGKVKFDDPVVERIRRAHLNDLENIPAFWVLAALYLTTEPVAAWATLLFRVYTLCRIIYTIVYALIPLPQPTRSIAYGVPSIIKWYMGYQVALYYISAFSYIVYSAILALKLLSVSAMTAIARMTRGIYANPEDAKTLKGKVKFDDPVVERIRRAHLNDLENIPAFWVLAALYLTTGPVAAWATLLFRVYTVSRIIHTIVYALIPLPQPARGIAYGIPYIIKWYMGIQVALYYISAV
ncbi:PREDICTED: uncharacterized protein LOC106108076 [Papilio polytes]|uniref:uncharacterized protein LOC106108076 n=1 Tax=Papilio polytes TaxID=76194 RepID=UPI0006761A13|nr:PREDICTED: uncharacterized protein LOC106108076 [Papilio polytes]